MILKLNEKFSQRIQVDNLYVKYNGRDYQIEDERGNVKESGFSTDEDAIERAKDIQNEDEIDESFNPKGYSDEECIGCEYSWYGGYSNRDKDIEYFKKEYGRQGYTDIVVKRGKTDTPGLPMYWIWGRKKNKGDEGTLDESYDNSSFEWEITADDSGFGDNEGYEYVMKPYREPTEDYYWVIPKGRKYELYTDRYSDKPKEVFTSLKKAKARAEELWEKEHEEMIEESTTYADNGSPVFMLMSSYPESDEYDRIDCIGKFFGDEGDTLESLNDKLNQMKGEGRVPEEYYIDDYTTELDDDSEVYQNLDVLVDREFSMDGEEMDLPFESMKMKTEAYEAEKDAYNYVINAFDGVNNLDTLSDAVRNVYDHFNGGARIDFGRHSVTADGWMPDGNGDHYTFYNSFDLNYLKGDVRRFAEDVAMAVHGKKEFSYTPDLAKAMKNESLNESKQIIIGVKNEGGRFYYTGSEWSDKESDAKKYDDRDDAMEDWSTITYKGNAKKTAKDGWRRVFIANESCGSKTESDEIDDGGEVKEEEVVDEAYDNPYGSNLNKSKAFDNACDCINRGYGKDYWLKKFKYANSTVMDDIWDSAQDYMTESVKVESKNLEESPLATFEPKDDSYDYYAVVDPITDTLVNSDICTSLGEAEEVKSEAGDGVIYAMVPAEDVKFESKKLTESSWDKISTSDLQDMIDRISSLIELMDDNNVEEINPSPNTYRLYNFLSFGGRGFIDLDDYEKYVPEEEYEDEGEEDEDNEEEYEGLKLKTEAWDDQKINYYPFREFTQQDYDGYGGAEKMPDGSEPLIYNGNNCDILICGTEDGGISVDVYMYEDTPDGQESAYSSNANASTESIKVLSDAIALARKAVMADKKGSDALIEFCENNLESY